MAEEEKKSTHKHVDAKHVEKKTEKHAEIKKVSHRSADSKSNSNTLLTITLGLVIIQLIVILGLGLMISEKDNQVMKIDEKVSRLDGFFAANAPGYADGTNPNAPPQDNGQQQAPTKVDESQLKIEGEPMIGDESATVTIVEFSDYECPFCSKFYTETYLKLKEEYIETGKVKLVFKDFPLGFHEHAIPAAVSASCVQAQLGDTKYFEMHDKIFENHDQLSQENLNKWAIELGADKTKYESCIADPAMTEEVNEDLKEGAELGVQGTPSFFINGNLIVGAQPYEVIKQMIDTELSQ